MSLPIRALRRPRACSYCACYVLRSRADISLASVFEVGFTPPAGRCGVTHTPVSVVPKTDIAGRVVTDSLLCSGSRREPRNPRCAALRASRSRGLWLFDAGESQSRLSRTVEWLGLFRLRGFLPVSGPAAPHFAVNTNVVVDFEVLTTSSGQSAIFVHGGVTGADCASWRECAYGPLARPLPSVQGTCGVSAMPLI